MVRLPRGLPHRSVPSLYAHESEDMTYPGAFGAGAGVEAIVKDVIRIRRTGREGVAVVAEE